MSAACQTSDLRGGPQAQCLLNSMLPATSPDLVEVRQCCVVTLAEHTERDFATSGRAAVNGTFSQTMA